MNGYEDKNGFCKYCRWECGYEESHIWYGNIGCEYIKSLYDVTMEDDDGEPVLKCVDKKTGKVIFVEF